MHGHVTFTVMEGKLAGKEYVFKRSRNCLIGRAHDCEIRLPDELDYLTVSRHHCLLELDPPAVRVRDLGSRNGTFVNGLRIGEKSESEDFAPFASLELHHGDVLQVGDTELSVTVYEPPAEAAVRVLPTKLGSSLEFAEPCLN
ncbi:MAG TPA: FHA domain-containing protein [Gemmataceae bacterium]|jgi:pSer/pThr/pTyr-binding forkhead associated (FHA) protein|nr:FHA domain-containing protein [Gemmataceae bacterium]